jgi:hypothetical protein
VLQSTQTLFDVLVNVVPSGQEVGSAQVSISVKTLLSRQLVHLSIRLTQSRHEVEQD